MYDAFSMEYDLFVNWPVRLSYELPFIQQLVQDVSFSERPLRVLDTACGTGQHALALAQSGVWAAGADISAGMITRAEQNREVSGLKVDFYQAGFGQLASVFRNQPIFPFDALLCLGNSLPHLLTVEDLAAALQDFAACLRPGGKVLLQNRNFDAVMAQQQRWMEPQYTLHEQTEWMFIRFYDYRADGLIDFNVLKLWREPGKNWQQVVHTTCLRPLLKDELISALEAVGFEDMLVYGDMSGSPFSSSSSGNLIITARVKK